MSDYLTPVDLQERALRILVRELGYADAMRFMLQFRRGEGDYTKARRKLLAGLDAGGLLAATQRRARRPVARKTPRRRSA